MRFQIANLGQTLFAFGLSLVLGAVLAYGFIPVSYRFFDSLSLSAIKELAFPLLAFIFYLSLRDSPGYNPSPYSTKRLLTLCVFPLIISLAFGATKNLNGVLQDPFFSWKPLLWTWVIIPVGEELLFRGWLTSVLNRLNRNIFPAFTPLYPLSLWGSSLAFSIWHLQNFESMGSGFLLFQVLYTFVVGIWLGLLKWQTGRIWPCVLAHALLNFAADWKLLFML